jgi:predicted flap endonuclease-1-like 5' DNA nuclease
MLVVTRRLVTLSAAALLIAVTLAACAQPTPGPTKSPVPTAKHTPAFASDAEALKAATDAYAAYLKMSDTILSEGADRPDRFRQVATGDALRTALDGVGTYAERGLHTTGRTTFDSARIQSIHDGRPHSVSIYVCDDVSNIDVVDSAGRSLVKPDRNPRTPFIVTVDFENTASKLVSGRTLWEGKDFC